MATASPARANGSPCWGGVPLWIAGGGEKKTLRIAAKYAQYTNFDGSPDVFKRKSEILEAHCREVGTDFGAIVRSAEYNVIIGETDKDVQDRLAWIRAHLGKYIPAEAADSTMRELADDALVGTPEQIAERLGQIGRLGMSYAIINLPDVAYDRSGLTLFAEQVAPALATA
jgi:alkanesulfonate monooxygenase SsuD/methylene tetrahydromethanopterin reductase-like flavin-dependent oxidoreductase (luciferase family)